MLISISEGTLAVFPSSQKGKYCLQFTLRGGQSFQHAETFDKTSAEQEACRIALSHPSWKDLELNNKWNRR